MLATRDCSGPGVIARTVSRRPSRERLASCMNWRHGSLSVNGSGAGGRPLGIARYTNTP